jgi:hypothetical protein
MQGKMIFLSRSGDVLKLGKHHLNLSFGSNTGTVSFGRLKKLNTIFERFGLSNNRVKSLTSALGQEMQDEI